MGWLFYYAYVLNYLPLSFNQFSLLLIFCEFVRQEFYSRRITNDFFIAKRLIKSLSQWAWRESNPLDAEAERFTVSPVSLAVYRPIYISDATVIAKAPSNYTRPV